MVDYQSRTSLFGKPVVYQLTDRELVGSNGRAVLLSDIKSIRIYRLPAGIASSAASSNMRRCTIRPAHGPAVILLSTYFVGLGNVQNRPVQFNTFVDALVAQTSSVSPHTIFIKGMPLALWMTWAIVLFWAALAMPLMIVFFLIQVFGDGPVATLITAIIGLAAIAYLLFIFLRPLGSDWPRKVDPKAFK